MILVVSVICSNDPLQWHIVRARGCESCSLLPSATLGNTTKNEKLPLKYKFLS